MICAWPPWASSLDQRSYDKRISGQDIAIGPDWTESHVERVRARGASFQYVRMKLKEANDCSETDLNTAEDSAKIKRSRRSRHRAKDSKRSYDSRESSSEDERDKSLLKTVGKRVCAPKTTLKAFPTSSTISKIKPSSLSQTPAIQSYNRKEGDSSCGLKKAQSSVPCPKNSAVSHSGLKKQEKQDSQAPTKPKQVSPHQPLSSDQARSHMRADKEAHTPKVSEKSLKVPEKSLKVPEKSLKVPEKSVKVLEKSVNNGEEEVKKTPIQLATAMSETDFRAFVISGFQYLRNVLCQLKNNQTSLQMKVAATNDSSNHSCIEDCLVGLPALTLEEFFQFEKKLKSDEKFSKEVETALSMIGGETLGSIVRGILCKVLTNSVACQFSWFGAKGKHKFEDLEFRKVLYRAVRKHSEYEKISDSTIKSPAASWLRLSKQRMGGGKKKPGEKQTTPKKVSASPRSCRTKSPVKTPHQEGKITMVLRSSTKKQQNQDGSPSSPRPGTSKESGIKREAKSARACRNLTWGENDSDDELRSISSCRKRLKTNPFDSDLEFFDEESDVAFTRDEASGSERDIELDTN